MRDLVRTLFSAAFAAGIAALPSPSAAQSIKAVLQQFNLLAGGWAADCDKPRSTRNWYGTYTAEGSQAELVYDSGKSKNVYKIVSARPLSATDLLMTQELVREKLFHEIVLRVEGDRYRTISSKLADGTFRVKDGKFTEASSDAGKDSPVLKRCR